MSSNWDSSEWERSWALSPDEARRYVDEQPRFEALCDEVTYLLRRALRAQGVELAYVVSRVKALGSVASKKARRIIDRPEEEVSLFHDFDDLAGVRAVYLYKSDFPKVDAVIRDHFSVRAAEDKAEVGAPETFGYRAVHYSASLRPEKSGVRYEDLKDLVCEIQARTVAQDAWATLAYHLTYKQEMHIPRDLRQRVHALSGLFATADDQFDAIRQARSEYLMKLEESLKNPRQLLAKEVDLDTLPAFLEWRFPGEPVARDDDELRSVFLGVDPARYPNLGALRDLLKRTKDKLDLFFEDDARRMHYTAAYDLAAALALEDPAYRKRQWGGRHVRDLDSLAETGRYPDEE